MERLLELIDRLLDAGLPKHQGHYETGGPAEGCCPCECRMPRTRMGEPQARSRTYLR